MKKELIVFDEVSSTLQTARSSWCLISSRQDFTRYLESDSQEAPLFSPGIFDVTNEEWRKVVDLFLTYPLIKKNSAKLAKNPRLDWLDARHATDFVVPDKGLLTEKFWKGADPEFSIVIPFRDRHETMTLVLERLSKISPEISFEAVLVNDGSSEESLSALKAELAKKNFSWTMVTLSPSQIFRAGIARNAGVLAARAEQIVFLDSDILVAPDFLLKVRQALSQGDLVQARRWQIWKNQWTATSDLSKISREEPNPFWTEFQTSTKSWQDQPQPWKYASTFCQALRKKDFLEVGGFRLWYSDYGFEDTDLGLRLYQTGKRLALIDTDVFHLSQKLQNEPYESVQKTRLQRSARKYFLINQAIDSLDWLIYLMM